MKSDGRPQRFPRRRFLGLLTSGAALSALHRPGSATAAEWRPASAAKLPRWRGFNLTEKLRLEANRPYEGWDFDFLSAWGFDFVRLPLDYRIWTRGPGRYDEAALKEIDQAIAWARARTIHTNLCLHRAPGYTVATPREPLNLWNDGPGGDEARRQFADQWRLFAARYRDIPPEQLSFNLVNEPPSITADQYARAAAQAVSAIRAEDPQRLIIADGRSGGSFGRVPTPELAPLGIAQSTRGYSPGTVTHYRASWVAGSDTWPVPSWPLVGFNAYLYGDRKRIWQSPLVLRVDIPQAAQFAINVEMVSAHARLVVRADGTTVLDQVLTPGPGAGEWMHASFIEQYNIYQAVYDKTYTTRLPAGTREIAVQVTDGDWLTFSEIRIGPYPRLPGREVTLRPGFVEWGMRQHTYAVGVDGSLGRTDGLSATIRQRCGPSRSNPGGGPRRWGSACTSGSGAHFASRRTTSCSRGWLIASTTGSVPAGARRCGTCAAASVPSTASVPTSRTKTIGVTNSIGACSRSCFKVERRAPQPRQNSRTLHRTGDDPNGPRPAPSVLDNLCATIAGIS